MTVLTIDERRAQGADESLDPGTRAYALGVVASSLEMDADRATKLAKHRRTLAQRARWDDKADSVAARHEAGAVAADATADELKAMAVAVRADQKRLSDLDEAERMRLMRLARDVNEEVVSEAWADIPADVTSGLGYHADGLRAVTVGIPDPAKGSRFLFASEATVWFPDPRWGGDLEPSKVNFGAVGSMSADDARTRAHILNAAAALADQLNARVGDLRASDNQSILATVAQRVAWETAMKGGKS